ncbi:hypothetical protein AVI51_16905 (plasmid) [Piscirickettsia salmonis]|nr:hypothetical protein AVI49_17020 [Piscirickettsia salmonis]APS52566.1 hypothetical protein AVI50_17110 [Piscirickettsia salmonis]APS55776.1 hypothetical protein AVI51_16905 [Piscirickettsia salmonis]
MFMMLFFEIPKTQEALVPRDTWISQGIYLYIVTEGDADIRIHDDPWPQEISSIPKEKFNQPFKWFQFKQTGKSGGDLGFMISIKDSSAPVTVYMMAPWLCYGYCDHWVDSGLNSQTLKKLT